MHSPLFGSFTALFGCGEVVDSTTFLILVGCNDVCVGCITLFPGFWLELAHFVEPDLLNSVAEQDGGLGQSLESKWDVVSEKEKCLSFAILMAGDSGEAFFSSLWI